MMSNRPKISVAVITYNQQDTIAQTLDSILMQKGDFELELVVGEDCGSDNTWKVCKEYEEQYPNQVKLLPNIHNLGIMANEARVLRACTGDFIGDIAGDDYYIDDHALEKQLDYLLQHPEVGVMGSNGYRFYVRRNEMVAGLNLAITVENDKTKEFYFSNSYPGGVYFRPIGMMYRRELLQFLDFDEMIRRRLPVEDYPIQAVLSQHTHFACLPDLLVVYRIYKESSTFVSLDDSDYLEYHRGLANTRRYLNELFPQDVCVTEEQLQEYEFYKEFLLYLHRLQYGDAKQLMDRYSYLAAQPHYKQAARSIRTRLHFVAFHFYKEYKFRKQRMSEL